MISVPSYGLKLHLAAWYPNAAEGAPLVSGAPLATWANRGSGVSDATQASTAHQPRWKAAGNLRAVQFDSVSDRLDVASSDSTLAFIHTTGVFDIFLCLRASSNKAGVVCGSAYNTGDKGFLVERTHTTVGSPLTLYLFLGPGEYRTYPTANYFAASFEPGVSNKILFRGQGEGTRLQASTGDFATITPTAGGGSAAALPALPTGNATNPLQIGAQGGGNFFGGDIFDVAIFNRNLSTSELVTMKNYFAERYTV